MSADAGGEQETAASKNAAKAQYRTALMGQRPRATDELKARFVGWKLYGRTRHWRVRPGVGDAVAVRFG